jgi:hypothetical protein
VRTKHGRVPSTDEPLHGFADFVAEHERLRRMLAVVGPAAPHLEDGAQPRRYRHRPISLRLGLLPGEEDLGLRCEAHLRPLQRQEFAAATAGLNRGLHDRAQLLPAGRQELLGLAGAQTSRPLVFALQLHGRRGAVDEWIVRRELPLTGARPIERAAQEREIAIGGHDASGQTRGPVLLDNVRRDIRDEPLAEWPRRAVRALQTRPLDDTDLTRERTVRLNPYAVGLEPWQYRVQVYQDSQGHGQVFTAFQYAASEAERLATERFARVLYVEENTPTLLADYRRP